MNNSDFGGFVVSKNVISGKPIRYAFREKSSVPQLNGWTIYSAEDDDAYVNDSKNFEVAGAGTMFEIAPVMLEIFNAPYGTDLCWLYTEGVHTGFYDLKNDAETSIDRIVNAER